MSAGTEERATGEWLTPICVVFGAVLTAFVAYLGDCISKDPIGLPVWLAGGAIGAAIGAGSARLTRWFFIDDRNRAADEVSANIYLAGVGFTFLGTITGLFVSAVGHAAFTSAIR